MVPESFLLLFELVEVGEEEEEEELPRVSCLGRSGPGAVPGLRAWRGVYWWMIGTSTAQYTPRRGSPPGQGVGNTVKPRDAGGSRAPEG